jgi:hypothetical protein
MRRVPLGESLRIIAQGSSNWLAQRPIVVSFEVTNSCTEAPKTLRVILSLPITKNT